VYNKERQGMQRILFLYLDTGGGHISGARALKTGIESLYPGEAEGFLLHGYPSRMVLDRLVMEQGYSLAVNHFMPVWLFIYRMALRKPLISLSQESIAQSCTGYIANYIQKHGITKVVCLHFILQRAAKRAIQQVNPTIQLATVVMDPFTVPPVWFGVKDQDFSVFSERARKYAISRGVSPERISVFPLMLRKEFEKPRPPEEIPELKRRYGFDPGKPLLLLAGGGDGLPRSDRIIREALSRGFDGEIAVVCGKNLLLRRLLREVRAHRNAENLKIFGFVDFMADLMAMADCVVTKGGPATVMETLALRKPLIVSYYVRGQERGNVQFVTSNQVGWYLTDPIAIMDKVEEVLFDPSLREELGKRIDGLCIQNGLSALSKHIVELPSRGCGFGDEL
jgi:hypothetical protein